MKASATGTPLPLNLLYNVETIERKGDRAKKCTVRDVVRRLAVGSRQFTEKAK
jgi:hypothetical protein